MPKSNLAKPQIHHNKRVIYNAITLAYKLKNYRQEDLARILKIHRTTVNHHLKNYSFDDEQINTLLDHFGLEIRICAKE